MVELLDAYNRSGGRPIPLLAQMGDSRLANGKNTSASDLIRQMQGVGSWIGVLTKGKVKAPLAANISASGSTLTSYATDGVANARGILPADGSPGQLADLLALSPRPSHCLLLTGTNDIGLGIQTLPQMQATMIQVWQQMLAAGIVPDQLLDLPRGWTVAASRGKHFAWNSWLLKYGPRYGAVIHDATGVLQDIANANGDPLASLYFDSPAIHPNSQGCYAAAGPIAAYFNSLETASVFHGFSRGDVYDATYNPGGNLMPNGGVGSGTGGTKVGTNVSGSVVDGMQVAILSGSATAVVCSVEARTDGGPGNWQKIDLTTSGACTIYFYPSTDITIAGGKIAIGETLEFGCDFEASGLDANVRSVTVQLANYNVNTPIAISYVQSFNTSYGPPPAAFAGRAEMSGDPMTIVANTTRVLPIASISVAGAVTNAILKVGGLALRKPQ